MLRLPSFRYLQPRSAGEAAAILSAEGSNARVVAGGTDLWPKMKRRQMDPSVIVGLRHLKELRFVQGSPEKGIALGPNLTLYELERNPLLLGYYPAVALAARSISSPPLKTTGTLGGNLCVDTRCNYYDQTYEWRQAIDFCLKKEGKICWVAPSSPRCWAVSSTDLAPVMLALNARIQLTGFKGERIIRAEELYKDDGIDFLAKGGDEIITAVHLPPVNGDRMTFKKLRRRGSIDFPILNVAVWVRLDSRGRAVEDARIAIGAVTSRPLLAVEAAQVLIGKPLTDDVIQEVSDRSSKLARPLDNTDLDFSWRRRMVQVWVRRALEELLRSDATH